jgi:hypothetical protein
MLLSREIQVNFDISAFSFCTKNDTDEDWGLKNDNLYLKD